MNYADIDKTYKDAVSGTDEPEVMFTPFGCFTRYGVHDFDDAGNLIDLSEKEQQERRDSLVKWIKSVKKT